jgi:hypothetical protein
MLPQSESLLKYENPVVISSGRDKDKKGAGKTLRKVRARDCGPRRPIVLYAPP